MKLRVWAAVAAVSGLAACGGGGGGGGGSGGPGGNGSSTQSDIRADNYLSFAGPSVRAASGWHEGGSTLRGLLLSDQAFTSGTSGDSNCAVSGTSRIVRTDADNDGRLSSGDSVTTIWNDCVTAPGAGTQSGQSKEDLTSLTRGNGGAITNYVYKTTFADARPNGTALLNGSVEATYAIGATQVYKLVYQQLSVIEPGRSRIVYDYTADGEAGAGFSRLALKGTLAFEELRYTFETDPQAPLQYAGTATPTSGVLRLTDAGGDSMRFSVLSASTTTAEFVPAGQTAAAQSSSMTWPQALALP